MRRALLWGGEHTLDVLGEVRDERNRQDGKWGEQNHGVGMWLAILTEEVGEVGKAINHVPEYSIEELRKELIQVAAVAVNWVEAIDRVR